MHATLLSVVVVCQAWENRLRRSAPPSGQTHFLESQDQQSRLGGDAQGWADTAFLTPSRKGQFGHRQNPAKDHHSSWAHRWRGESAPGTALRTAHRPGCYPPPLRVPDTVHGRHHHSRRSAPFRRHFSATRWSSGAHGFEAALEEPARCRFSPAIHPALHAVPWPSEAPTLAFPHVSLFAGWLTWPDRRRSTTSSRTTSRTSTARRSRGAARTSNLSLLSNHAHPLPTS